MPKTAIGTYELKGNKYVSTVRAAIELAYRHIDTAQMYCNQGEVGQAIREAAVSRRGIFGVSNFPAGLLREAQAVAARAIACHQMSCHFGAAPSAMT